MRFAVLVGVFFGLVALAVSAPAPLLYTDSPTVVPNQYIIIFKDGLSAAVRESHIKRVKGLSGVVVKDMHIWNFHDFAGYSATLSASTVTYVRNAPEVKYVEADQVVTADACVTQNSATWGLDRVSEKAINLDGVYEYPDTAGSGVDAYIVDTGILITHVDFGGRATWGENFVDSQDTDCNGHGTHVAGTTGGTAYGVAKKVNLIAVKVLNCAGSGTNAGVISGIQYVATKSTGKPSVANMSLGGGYSASLNAAVKAAVDSGVTFVVAAGNSNADACSYSPASEPSAISVCASDIGESGSVQEDVRSYFSNYGSCTDVFAPGTAITSDWIGSNSAINTISGTSMASPHVCGVAALMLADQTSLSPAQIKSAIANVGTDNVIDLACGGNAACLTTPNIMLFNTC